MDEVWKVILRDRGQPHLRRPVRRMTDWKIAVAWMRGRCRQREIQAAHPDGLETVGLGPGADKSPVPAKFKAK